MWNSSKAKPSSYFSDYNGTIMARAVRGKVSDAQSYPPRAKPSNLPTRSDLPLRMVISDMARRREPSPQTETSTPPHAYLQEPRDMYSESPFGSFQDKYLPGKRNKDLPEKIQTSNVINEMRKKFNLMYGKRNVDKDEGEEEYSQINEADETSNPQKIKFTELYGKRPDFPPPDMMSFAEFVERVNKKSSIMAPQKRSWVDESFEGKTDDRDSSLDDASEMNCSNRNSRRSWKKRYLSTEMFLHSIQEEWPDSDDHNDSAPASSAAEEFEATKYPSNGAVPLDIRKRKGGIFNDSFEISPEKKNRFAPHLSRDIFADAVGGDTSGEESVTSEGDKILNDDINNKTTDYPFYEDLLTVCSQDSVYSDDSTDTKKTAFQLNNVQLYDAE